MPIDPKTGQPLPPPSQNPQAMPGGQRPPAPGNPSQVPPAFARFAEHIDPNNPLQAELLKRLSALSPEEVSALRSGVSPAAQEILRKLLPEVAFLMGQGGGSGAPPATPPGAGGAPPPRNMLRQIGG
jgi:hypothetical protein